MDKVTCILVRRREISGAKELETAVEFEIPESETQRSEILALVERLAGPGFAPGQTGGVLTEEAGV